MAIEAHGPDYARNRVLYQVRLAETRLRLGNVVGAADAADAALDDLAGEVVSWVVDAELRSVAQALTGHRTFAEVESFLHRYAIYTNF